MAQQETSNVETTIIHRPRWYKIIVWSFGIIFPGIKTFLMMFFSIETMMPPEYQTGQNPEVDATVRDAFRDAASGYVAVISMGVAAVLLAKELSTFQMLEGLLLLYFLVLGTYMVAQAVGGGYSDWVAFVVDGSNLLAHGYMNWYLHLRSCRNSNDDGENSQLLGQ